jgi:putative Mg2+ transporter-C (MgtC) family protein
MIRALMGCQATGGRRVTRPARGEDPVVDLDPVLRILSAAAMALPIGLDRELRGKAAGVRTHVLLAAACAGLGYLSIDLAAGDSSADPTRIASYTVAGIGFLGAGLIVGVRGRVYGLTTAVGAFAVMAIGVLCGTGYEPLALALTVVVLVTLWPLDWVKTRVYGRIAQAETTLHAAVEVPRDLPRVLGLPAAHGVELRGVEVQPVADVVVVQLTVRGKHRQLEALCAAMQADPATAGRPVMSGLTSGDGD